MALFGQRMLTAKEENERIVDDGLERLGVTREALREEAIGDREKSEAELLFEEHGLGDLLRRDEPLES